MRVFAFVAALCAFSCAPQGWDPDDRPPGAVDPDNPFIQQDGTRLRDREGNTVFLAAVNLGGWLLWEGWMWKREPVPGSGIQQEQVVRGKLRALVGDERAQDFARRVHENFVTDADLARIKALGFNAVRVPMNYRLFEEDAEPYTYKESAWAVLDRLVEGCEAHGLVAILDFHSVPGGQAPYFMEDPGANALWTSEAYQDRTVALWRAIAERYKDRPGIGGYDLLNEPLPPEGEMLFQLYRRIAATIREVDRNHLIIVEGANYAGDFSLFRAPVTFNQAYSFHQYVWVGDPRQEELDRWHAMSEAHGIPLWNGEFGISSVEMVASSRDLYADPANGLCGFGYWTWKETPQGLPHLVAISAPIPKWEKLYAWITGGPFAPQPTLEEAEAGMDEFIAALPLERCEEDPDMVAALQGNR